MDAAICRSSAAEEQAWTTAALRDRVARPSVRVWIGSRPAVVLGCSGRPDAAMSARAGAAGADLCVRPTGGGAVLAGPWLLSASVVLPPDHPLVARSIARSFGWLGSAHRDWLEALGVATQLVTQPDVRRDDPLAWACFAGLSYGELVVDGRKIVGLSQARRRNGVVYASGALVSASPWEVLCDVVGRPPEQAGALAARTLPYSDVAGSAAPTAALAQSLLEALCAAVRAA